THEAPSRFSRVIEYKCWRNSSDHIFLAGRSATTGAGPDPCLAADAPELQAEAWESCEQLTGGRESAGRSPTTRIAVSSQARSPASSRHSAAGTQSRQTQAHFTRREARQLPAHLLAQ